MRVTEQKLYSTHIQIMKTFGISIIPKNLIYSHFLQVPTITELIN